MPNTFELVAGPPSCKQGAVADAAMTQGQWGLLANPATASNDPEVTPVASDANAQLSAYDLFPVFRDPEYDEDLETFDAIDAAERCVRVVGSGVLICDAKLVDNVADAVDFTVTPGTDLVLTSTGYPTVTGSSDAVSAGTVVAKLERFIGSTGNSNGGVVYYRTV